MNSSSYKTAIIIHDSFSCFFSILHSSLNIWWAWWPSAFSINTLSVVSQSKKGCRGTRGLTLRVFACPLVLDPSFALIVTAVCCQQDISHTCKHICTNAQALAGVVTLMVSYEMLWSPVDFFPYLSPCKELSNLVWKSICCYDCVYCLLKQALCHTMGKTSSSPSTDSCSGLCRPVGPWEGVRT